MKYVRACLLILFLATVGPLLGACATTGSQSSSDTDESIPYRYETHLTAALFELGHLLRAYPVPRPYQFDKPVIVEPALIPNDSGEEGLPPNLSTILTTITSRIGFPIRVKPTISIAELEAKWIEGTIRQRPQPDLSIHGSVTEGEKWRTREKGTDLDLLYPDRGSDGKPGRDAVDTGFSAERGDEVRRLALDLHLLNEKTGLIEEAVSCRIHVVRRGRSFSYGLFFDGSGIGFRGQTIVAQSKSQALRIAAQQGVLILLGRYFRVPYWRVIPGTQPDQKLVDAYREVLANGMAPDDFRLLLFAHGLDISLNTHTFSEEETKAVAELKQRLRLGDDASDLDLAMHLWLNVPYSGTDSRLNALRNHLLSDGLQTPSRRPTVGANGLLGLISDLRPGQELLVPVYFEYNQSTLSEPAKKRIDLLIEALETSPLFGSAWWFDLRGHTDARGEHSKNQELSERRAARVSDYLEQKHSVPGDKIATAGLGSSEPKIEEAKSESDHRQNRRVEILLVAGERPEPSLGKSTAASSQSKQGALPTPLFPPEQWPLPKGVDLPSELDHATLSLVRRSFPIGRYSNSFGYYLARLAPGASPYFSEVVFFFTSRMNDPIVKRVGFRCRAGAEARLAPAIEMLYPQAPRDTTSRPVVTWEDLDGYRLTVGLDRYCLEIEPAR